MVRTQVTATHDMMVGKVMLMQKARETMMSAKTSFKIPQGGRV